MRNAVFVLIIGLCLSISSQAQPIKGDYAIKNVSTGMLLRPLEASNKNETPIVAYNPVNWKCMTWDFKRVDGNIYVLRNLLTGKTFQPVKGGLGEGVGLEQEPLDENSAQQQWEFIQLNNQSFLIKLKGTEYYLTPSQNNSSTNSRIVLSKKRNDNLQHWSIYEQHPTM